MKEVLLAVVKTVSATNQTNQAVSGQPAATLSPGAFFASIPMPPLELVYRGVRVVAVFFGILFLLTLLRGAFKYIVCSGRDDTVIQCRRTIITGAVGVLVMFFLYFFASSGLLHLLSDN